MSVLEPKLIGAAAHPVPETLIVTFAVAGLMVMFDPALVAVMQAILYVPGAVSVSWPPELTERVPYEPGTRTSGCGGLLPLPADLFVAPEGGTDIAG
jgi:hypothetical protein